MATPRKKRITRLKVAEGSLVDRPANPHCRVVLFKRAADDHLPRWLKAELRSISLEEAPADRERLMLEVVDDFWQGLQAAVPEHEERIEMQQTSELDRMLRYVAAGGSVHSWADTDVMAAMDQLAAEIVPDAATPEQALAKSMSDRRQQQLYQLYQNAEPAAVEEPVELRHESTPAEAEIERLARALMKDNASFTFAHAVSRVMQTAAGIRLYEEHRRQLTERYSRRGPSR